MHLRKARGPSWLEHSEERGSAQILLVALTMFCLFMVLSAANAEPILQIKLM